ncbi:antibiotic biosynthesis monooxygenase [Candidatus Nitrosopelagicus sp.]|nr:antibiotic biosynthesis monooxygenase [Candidatus Nitrosopelagicus sp.]
MFIAIVDVSLKEEKISEFKTWITESNKMLSKFDGFISRRLLEGEDGSKRIMVEFENIELFRKMHQSPEHQNFHSELEVFMAKPPQRQFYHVVAE